MKKITNKEIFMGVLVVSFAVIVLVYMMVFTKYKDMTSSLKTSNDALQQQADEMEDYYNNMSVYQTEILQMTEGIEERTKTYPSQANEEDFLMTAVEMQENAIISYTDINIEGEKTLLAIPEETVKGAAIEDYQSVVEFMQRKATYSNTTNYAELRKCVETIYNSPYRVGINAINYSKVSETNNFIEGTIDISYYSVLGMNKPYEYPEMDEYVSSTQELFGKLIMDEDEVFAVEE